MLSSLDERDYPTGSLVPEENVTAIAARNNVIVSPEIAFLYLKLTWDSLEI
jgi:hypothetical protein